MKPSFLSTLRIIVIAAFCLSAPLAAFGAARIVETGSTLLYPVMTVWVQNYSGAHPGVQIDTNDTGSGVGIADASSGAAQIGASDAYLNEAQMNKSALLNIAVAVSAQLVSYNIPEIGEAHLHLSGPVLAAIYDGSLGYWDDARIKALNGAFGARLPHRQIIPIHRSDNSGDTFIFTQYLSDSAPDWAKRTGFGTHVNWPNNPKALDAKKNAGMTQTCATVPYSIAYIGISFFEQAKSRHLGYAALQNRSGAFIEPSSESVSAAARAVERQTPPDERVSLIFAPGKDSYPIVNYEYLLVKAQQSDASMASELAHFLQWVVEPNGGNAPGILAPVHFVPLPAHVLELSRKQISKIH